MLVNTYTIVALIGSHIVACGIGMMLALWLEHSGRKTLPVEPMRSIIRVREIQK